MKTYKFTDSFGRRYEMKAGEDYLDVYSFKSDYYLDLTFDKERAVWIAQPFLTGGNPFQITIVRGMRGNVLSSDVREIIPVPIATFLA